MHRISRLALAALALAVPANASAATVSGQITSTAVGFQGKGVAGGVRFYVAPYRARITISGYVRDDYGSPIPGATVHLSTIVHDTDVPAPLADVVTNGKGRYTYALKPGSTYTYFTAVDAGSAGTAGAVPALHVGLVPNVAWTRPLLGQKGSRYRFDGRIDIPSPAASGTIVLTRLDSKLHAVKRLGTRTPGTDGSFHFAVVHRRSGRYYYRIAFVPRDRAVWAPLTITIGVDFRKR